jgi:branched-chain amino acid transport system ATP-binding protein
MTRILLVEDEKSLSEPLSYLLRREGYEVQVVDNGLAAVSAVEAAPPDLMLLDEPSEGIQPSIVKEIARNIKRLNAETGLTVLFVEQNLDLIVNLAQRGFVIDKGRIIAEVGPDEIKDREKVKKWLAL